MASAPVIVAAVVVGNCNLTNLPSVLKERIALFLEPREAYRLSKTCRQLHSDLGLSVLSPPYEYLFSQVWVGETMTGDLPRRSEEIPILSIRPHSIGLQCRWKDQGYGDRKGRLYVIGEPKRTLIFEEKNRSDHSETNAMRNKEEEEEATNLAPFEGGSLVYESPLAPHTFSNLKVTFVPRPNETYHLWYRCGGGGGHLLMVEELIVNTLFFDDKNRNWTSHYKTLNALGVLVDGSTTEEDDCEGDDDDDDNEQAEGSFSDLKKDVVFFTDLLRNVARSLRSHDNEYDCQPSPLSTFLESKGLVLNPLTLTATEEICNSLLQLIHPTTKSDPASKILQSVPKPPPPSVIPQLRLGVASFLDTPDALNLCWANNEMHSKFSFSTLSPLKLPLPFGSWVGNGRGILSSSIPIPVLAGRTHSVRISCQWKDLGFGPGNGKLLLLATSSNRGPSEKQQCLPLGGARIVFESPVAPSEMSDLEMTLIPREGEFYYLHPKAPNDGGEYSLHVENVTARITIFDDGDTTFADTFGKLDAAATFNDPEGGGDPNFFAELLLASVQHLYRRSLVAGKENLATADRILLDFFQSRGFELQKDGSLLVLEELVSLLVGHNGKKNSNLPVDQPTHDSLGIRTFNVM
jgi:hypothetical protein